MSGDERAQAFEPRAARPSSRLPGARAAAIIAIISALIAGYRLRTGDAAADGAASPGNSRLAEVAPDEIGAALETVAASPEETARFQAREACRRKLAWVTIARLPTQPPGRIRLRSGRYVSPAFELSDVPVRVALPYPAPYPAGHGTIAVVGTTADADVALTPPWQVTVRQGLQWREVTWTPVGACPSQDGPPK